MADLIFNVAKGRVAELHDRVDKNDPTNSVLVVLLLKVSASDAALKDLADVGSFWGNGCTECDATNYARKILNDSQIVSSTVDQANDRRECDIPDVTWTGLGGAVNNSLVKLVIAYDPDSTTGDDSTLVPLAAFDFPQQTNGSDVTAVINAAGYFRAT